MLMSDLLDRPSPDSPSGAGFAAPLQASATARRTVSDLLDRPSPDSPPGAGFAAPLQASATAHRTVSDLLDRPSPDSLSGAGFAAPLQASATARRTASDLILYRLHNQHLLSPGADPAADLCGLQAQFLRNAVHALRIRSHEVFVDDLVKTWTLRGTVHLVPERDLPVYIRHCGGAEDVCQSGWYQWTAGRNQANPPEREIELARLTLAAIAGGVDEREALRLHLRSCGMTEQEEARVFNPWGGMIAELANIGALAFRVEVEHRSTSGSNCMQLRSIASTQPCAEGWPEVDMLDDLCPVETKRYRLLAPFEPMEEGAARLELARRYFTHYGPATLRDAAYFFHWTQAELKALLARLPVETVVADGKTYFYLPNGEPARDLPEVILLAGFDPLMMGYRKEDNPVLPPEHLRGIFNLAGIVNPAILLHGRVVGKWKEKDGVVSLTAFELIPDVDRKRIVEEVIRLFIPKKIKWI